MHLHRVSISELSFYKKHSPHTCLFEWIFNMLLLISYPTFDSLFLSFGDWCWFCFYANFIAHSLELTKTLLINFIPIFRLTSEVSLCCKLTFLFIEIFKIHINWTIIQEKNLNISIQKHYLLHYSKIQSPINLFWIKCYLINIPLICITYDLNLFYIEINCKIF